MKNDRKVLAPVTALLVTVLLAALAIPLIDAGTGSASGSDPLSSSPMSPLATGTGSLLASTFFGSGGEVAVTGTATAEDGTVYVTGYVTAGTLPTTSGAYDRIRNSEDGFVARFSADLGTLLASTYVGGSDKDRCTAIALGYDGSVYVTGYTASSDPITGFPTTVGAYDRSYNGGISDVFVSRFAPDLKTLIASTYLGGSNDETPTDLVLTADRVIVVGSTYSSDFPIVGGYDASYNGNSDGFVSALDLGLASLKASTFIGSPADDRINAVTVFDGRVYFTGSTEGNYPTTSGAYDRVRSSMDAFVTSMPLSLSSLAASTYLGGSSDDYGSAIAVDSTGVYVAGYTASSNFPAVNGYDTSYNGGISDGFVSKLSLGLNSMVASTFLGGGAYDRMTGLLVSNGQVFVVGQSDSSNFPAVDAYASANSGGSDVVISHLDASLSSLVYSTYLGGAADDAANAIALTPAGGIIVAGFTRSSGFPIVGGYDASYNGGANGQDGFLARLDIGGAATHAQWSQWQGDVQHTGVYNGEVPEELGLLWYADVPAAASSSVAVGEDKVFVYSAGKITALYAVNGTEAWSEDCLNVWNQHDFGTWASPVYADGLVFAPGDTARHASDGTPAWGDGKGLRMGVSSGPLVVEGKVIQADWINSTYYCYNEFTGDELWNVSLAAGPAQGTPAYYDGKLFITAYGSFSCVDINTGAVRWSIIPAGYDGSGGGLEFCGSPAVAYGRVYVTTYNGTGNAYTYSYYASNGTLAWSSATNLTYATPAVADGKVYVSGGWEGLAGPQTICLNAFTGAEVWNISTIGDHLSSAVIAGDRLFVGGSVLDASNGALQFTLPIGGTASFGYGKVFGVVENRVYAFAQPTAAPAAAFEADVTSGPAPLTVQFTDLSTGATSWSWSFGDGTTSTERNPSHQYTTEGTFTVTLTATNSYGSDAEVKSGYITVTNYPVADFVANVTSGVAPLAVQFTDLSIGATSWSWDFGDGTNSTERNPAHTYAAVGNYTVSLTATNSAGNNTVVKSGYITVSATAGEASVDWPQFQGGLYNDGVTENDGPITDPSLLWTAKVEGQTGFSGMNVAPIVADGKVFVIDRKGYVYAFSMDGTQLWANKTFALPGSSFQLSTPAYHDGVLYVVIQRQMGQGANVFALDADNGQAIWSRLSIVTGFNQANTPVVYDDGRIFFGTWYSSSGNGKYFCLSAVNGTTLWERSATTGQGYYWAGAAVIGNYIVYGDEVGRVVSLYKNNGTLNNEVFVADVFGIANDPIRSAVSYSEDTHRIYFTTKQAYCLALGFDRDSGTFDTGDKWATYLGTHSTSTPAVYGGKVYVGSGDFSGANKKFYCLNESDGTEIWNKTANNGIQASPVVSLNDNGEVYVYFTTNTLLSITYCLYGSNGTEAWNYSQPSGLNEHTLQGVAIYDGKVFFGNDRGYLFCLGVPED